MSLVVDITTKASGVNVLPGKIVPYNPDPKQKYLEQKRLVEHQLEQERLRQQAMMNQGFAALMGQLGAFGQAAPMPQNGNNYSQTWAGYGVPDVNTHSVPLPIPKRDNPEFVWLRQRVNEVLWHGD